MNNKLFHAMNFTKTFIDVESGQFISLPKDGTDKPPVNADINNNIDTFHSTGGEGTPSEQIPIVNVSEYDKTVCGKNLFDKSNYSSINGYISDKVYLFEKNITVYLKCKPNTTYTMSKSIPSYRFNWVYTNELPAVNVTVYALDSNPNGELIANVTTGANAQYLVGWIKGGSDTAEMFTQILNSLQVEIGTTPTTYNAYNGKTYPYRLEDVNGVLHEAGDLPDGTADSVNWETGEFVERVKKLIFDGSSDLTSWNYYNLGYDDKCLVFYRDTSNAWGSNLGYTLNARCNNSQISLSETINKLQVSKSATHTSIDYLQTNTALGIVAEDTTEQKRAKVQSWIAAQISTHGNIKFQYELATPQIYKIKQYGKTYGGVVWEYNEKPKSIQYHTNIFTDKNITMQCEVRKLGNRAMILANLKTSSGKVLMTESGKIIQVKI